MATDSQRRSLLAVFTLRCRHFLPCIYLIIFLTFIQLFALVLRDNSIVRSTYNALLTYGGHYSEERILNRGSATHVLLVSYARTGSSFVGDLLQSFPGTFYYFEPLHFLSSPVLNGSFYEARVLLDKMFHCNASQVNGFLPWIKKHYKYMKLNRNFRYWRACSKKRACYDGAYLDEFCRNHSIIVVKSIRINLKEAAKLFENYPDHNLKIIYLSRDPRGTLTSRRTYPVTVWCKRDPMCSNAESFCALLKDDMDAVCSLSVERPGDFTVIRYEDLSINSSTVAEHLASFLGFPFVPRQVQEFLKEHTSFLGNVKEKSKTLGLSPFYSTYRNSSATATSWRKKINPKLLATVQKNCKSVLDAMGYHSYSSLPVLRSNLHLDLRLEDALRLTCSSKTVHAAKSVN